MEDEDGKKKRREKGIEGEVVAFICGRCCYAFVYRAFPDPSSLFFSSSQLQHSTVHYGSS